MNKNEYDDLCQYKGLIGELVVLQDLIRLYHDKRHVADVEELENLFRTITIVGELRFNRAIIQHGILVNHVMDFMIRERYDLLWRFLEVKSTSHVDSRYFNLNGEQYKFLNEPDSKLAVVRLPEITLTDYRYDTMQKYIDASVIEYYKKGEYFFRSGFVIIDNNVRRVGIAESRGFKGRKEERCAVRI